MCYTSLLVTVFSAIVASANAAEFLINRKVTTYIDASSQLVKVNNKITIENTFTESINSYLFIVDPQWKNNLSYIVALDSQENTLNVNRVITDDSWLQFEIILQHSLLPGETETIKVFSVIVNFLRSYPKSVKQYEQHLVLLSFNVYYYSAYFTKEQKVYLFLGTPKILSVDGAKYDIADNDNYGLRYGPYLNLSHMSENPSMIHYENSSPFLTVQKLKRFIKISHWGYITVWEQISLVNTGPTFTGPYERLTMSKDNPPDTRIDSFVTSLPGDAFDIYLRDEIGMLSSFVVDDSDSTKVDVAIKPRFVLYGGWKTFYEIGYSLPTYDFLFYDHTTGEFILSIPFIDKIFPNMVIKEVEVKYILPEGANFIDINPYFELENNTNNRYCYFLDVICREIVSFKRHNLVEQHGTMVVLAYNYSQVSMLSKPLEIIVFLYAAFIIFIIYTRLNISLPTENRIGLVPIPHGMAKKISDNKEEIKHKKTSTKTKSKKC